MKRTTSFFLLLATACGGGSGTEPKTVATVTVSGAASVIQVGQTATLTAIAKDIGGNPISGRAVAWSSSAISIATVSSTGLVTGVSAGSAVITASVDGKAGTLTIGVSTAATGADCTGITPLSLAAGEVKVLSGTERSSLCISGGLNGGEYALIAVNAASTRQPATATFSPANTNAPTATVAAAVRAQAAPSVSPRAISGLAEIAGSMPRNVGFEMALRSQWRAEARLRRAAAPARSRRPATMASIRDLPPSPSVGSLINLNASSTSSCEVPLTRTARVMAVSNSAIIVEDTTAPAGGFTQAEYVSIATTFDTLVFPLDTTLFGAPYDMDTNGRVLLFFTTAVNQRTPSQGATSVIGGFFWERDLIPRQANATVPFACANSNEGEMFYLPVVDVGNRYNPYFNNKTAMLSEINATVIHEFQHLINASHRYYITPEIVEDEEGWLNEAMSHIAEEALYYRLVGYSARSDLNFSQTAQPAARLDLLTNYQLDNLSRFNAYLKCVETCGAFPLNEDLSTRGASWVLLRWALDHSTGTERSYLHALVSAPTQGIPNFNNVFAGVGGLAGALRASTVAHYSDNLPTSTNPTYSHLSWNFRDWLPHFTSNSNTYPLQSRLLINGGVQQLTLPAGGGALFLRFRVNPGATGSVAITLSGTAPAAGTELVLVRVS
jgi:hypothetical protein